MFLFRHQKFYGKRKRNNVKLCFSFLYISMLDLYVMLAFKISNYLFHAHVLETSNSFTGTSSL